MPIRKRPSWTSNPGSPAPDSMSSTTTDMDKVRCCCVHEVRGGSWRTCAPGRWCLSVSGYVHVTGHVLCVPECLCVWVRVPWGWKVILRGPGGENNSNSGLGLLLPGHVIMDKSLNLSEPQSPLSDVRAIHKAYFQGLLKGVNDTRSSAWDLTQRRRSKTLHDRQRGGDCLVFS